KAAEESLKRIRKTDNVTAELDAIADTVKEMGNEMPIKEFFTTKKVLERLGIGIGVHVLSQTTGINPIFVYGGIIYQSVLG
ncbi:unnamed protein product, partial [Rotaria magnacalcarata]